MYKTPKACYTKAPVRRETGREEIARRRMQLPRPKVMVLLMKPNRDGMTYPGDDLVPGKPKFVKDPIVETGALK